MNKKIAITIGIIIVIAVLTYVVTNEFSDGNTKEIGEKNGSTPTVNKSKTYEITASETVGIRSP